MSERDEVFVRLRDEIEEQAFRMIAEEIRAGNRKFSYDSTAEILAYQVTSLVKDIKTASAKRAKEMMGDA